MSTVFDSPVYLILGPIIGAVLVALVGWSSRFLCRWLSVLTLLANLALAWAWRTPATPAPFSLGTMAVAGQQLTFTLRGDALSGLSLVLLAAGSALATVYAATAPVGWRGSARGALALLLAMAAANGVLLAGDLLTLYGFAALASLCLLLLLLSEPTASAQQAGFKLFAALEILGLAPLLVILPTLASGTGLDLATTQSWARSGLVGEGVLLAVLLALVSRAGFVPLHTWLAEALERATWPAATLIAALSAPLGSYLLLRLGGELLGPRLPLSALLLALGSATVLVAGYAAVGRRRVRQVLAALTLAQGGFFALALAGGGALGTEAALAQLLYTALFGALPFIAMGSLLGDADGESPSALPRATARRPLAALIAAASLLAAAGLPPFYGFYARIEVLLALVAAGSVGHYLGVLAVLVSSGALMAAVAKLIATMFAREESPAVTGWWQGRGHATVPAVVAALLMLIFAAAPFSLQRWLVAPALAVASPTAAAFAGLTWRVGLAGVLLLLALYVGGWLFLSAGRMPALPHAVAANGRAIAAALDRLAAAGHLDPYRLVVVLVTSIGRAVALACGAVLDRLAI